MNKLVYVVSGNRQGFFNPFNGKYVPVTKQQFDKWKRTKKTWWYTLGIIKQSGPQILIELNGTRAWNHAITPDEHFRLCKPEFKELLDNNEGVLDIIHIIKNPNCQVINESSMNRIIQILGGEHDTGTQVGNKT